MKNKGILTFDLEFWHNTKFLEKYLQPADYQINDCTEKTIELLLGLLNQYNQKATFFVLGNLAEKYPSLIRKISDQGHEIASHGYSHITLDKLDKQKFEKEIVNSQNLLRQITEQKIIGFRAPNFSLTNKTIWALEILKKNNFKYDASTFLKKNKSKEVLRITTCLGGIYFRILPLRLFLLINNLFKAPLVLYFHPNELFNFTPQLKSAPWVKRKIKYCGAKNALKKFEKLLTKFKFISIQEYLNENPIN